MAVEIATTRPVRGLILESTFTSLKAMARKTFPLFPTWWFAKSRFPTDERIASIEVPILLFHGEVDEIVPFSHGRRLAGIVGENLEFVAVPGAGHNDLSERMGAAYFEKVGEFVDRCLTE